MLLNQQCAGGSMRRSSGSYQNIPPNSDNKQEGLQSKLPLSTNVAFYLSAKLPNICTQDRLCTARTGNLADT